MSSGPSSLPFINTDRPPDEHAAELQSIYALVLEHVQARSSADDLKLIAAAVARVLGQWKSRDEPGHAWLAWYVGHFEGLLGLLRSALVHRLPTAAARLLERKHVAALLGALESGDRTLSDLKDVIGRDLSYTLREVGLLAAAQLVRTSKEDRARRVGLTPLGVTALEQVRASRKTLVPIRIARALESLQATIGEVVERQNRVDGELAALKAAQQPAAAPLTTSTNESLYARESGEPMILAFDGRPVHEGEYGEMASAAAERGIIEAALERPAAPQASARRSRRRRIAADAERSERSSS
jgi:DNA-binding MarR family transcriptional regulator